MLIAILGSGRHFLPSKIGLGIVEFLCLPLGIDQGSLGEETREL